MKPFQIQLFVVLLQFKPEPFEPNQKFSFRFKSLLDWTEKQVWGVHICWTIALMWKKFNLRHLNWTKLGFKVQAKDWTKLKVQFKVQKNLLWTGPDWTVATLTFWPLNCEWFTALLSFACDLAQTIFPFWFWAHFQNVVVWIWWLGACKYRAHDYLNLKMCFIWEVRMMKTGFSSLQN